MTENEDDHQDKVSKEAQIASSTGFEFTFNEKGEQPIQDKKPRQPKKEEQTEKEEYKIFKENLDKLKPHPKNTEIYGNEEIDLDLVESIIENGQLEPIVVTHEIKNSKKTKNYLIISGHRRWQALKKIKEDIEDEEEREQIQATCYYKKFDTDFEIWEAIIEFNRQRIKVPGQIYKEIKLLDEVLVEKAKHRKENNLKRGSDVPISALREDDKTEIGRTNEIEAEKLNLGKERVRKIRWIGDLIDESNPDPVLRKDAEKVMDELNSGEAVETGYKKLQIITTARTGKLPKDLDKPESVYADKLKEYASKLEDQINRGLSPNQACQRFKKYFEELEEEPPKTNGETSQTNEKVSLGICSVIVANPPNTDKAKRIKITESENAALFLWTTTSNLKDRIGLLEKWDFSLKDIWIWNTEKATSIYFRDGAEFILLGIRGNIENSDFRPDIIFNAGNLSNESKSVLLYEIAEEMFPNEIYGDLNENPKRSRWKYLGLKE
jgi:hypothetical protein